VRSLFGLRLRLPLALVVASVPLVLAGASCAQGNEDTAGDGGDGVPEVDAGPAGETCPGGVDAKKWYFDGDGDGFGDSAQGQIACFAPADHVEAPDDCDDANPYRNPGAAEVCDGADNDCNTATSETCANGCVPTAREGRVYLFCSGVATWPQARDLCRAQQMDLVIVDDAAENAWLLQNAGLPPMTEEVGLWLRATDQGSEGSWVWADGPAFWNGDQNGAPVAGALALWREGEPNDFEGVEDCGELLADGGWNDLSCTASRTFACERE